jgi:hypothetical protein
MTITGAREYSGLFGYAYMATIKNVGMEGTNISFTGPEVSATAGAVCAYLDRSVIINCYNTGTISITASSNNVVGGIGGILRGSDSRIESSYNTGTISVTDIGGLSGSTGGLCGRIIDDGVGVGIIINSYNTGNITSNHQQQL